MAEEFAPSKRPVSTLKLGGLVLKGPAAVTGLIVLLLGVARLIYYVKPSVRMVLTSALWIGFINYWNIAAKNSSPAKSSESRQSRRLHENLLLTSLLLLFVPIPGLRGRFRPAKHGSGPLRIRASVGFGASGALGAKAFGAKLERSDYDQDGSRAREGRPISTRATSDLQRHAGDVRRHGARLRRGPRLVGTRHHRVCVLRKIRLEERTLGETFGPDYDAYRSTSWALIPGLV